MNRLGPRRLLSWSLLLILTVASRASGEDVATAKDAEYLKALAQGQAKLEKGLGKTVAKVSGVAGSGVVALLRIQPVRESDLGSPTAGLLDGLLQRALLRGGVRVRDVETAQRIPALYRHGRLSPKSRIDAAHRARLREEMNATFSLEAHWTGGEGRYDVLFRMRDLVTGRTKGKWNLSRIDARKVPLGELTSIQPLPDANVEILLFAIRMLGKRVDRGECWDLPALPLKARGVKIRGYTFGTPVSFADALPGDVVTIDARGHQHVMVLWQKRDALATSSILHQNWSKKRHVMVMRYPKQMIQDSIIWRPGS